MSVPPRGRLHAGFRFAWCGGALYHSDMTSHPSPLSAPPGADSQWVVDRGFLWLGTTVWALGYWFPSLMPLGLGFREMMSPLLIGSVWIIVRRFALASLMLPYINLGSLLILIWIVLSAAWAPAPVFALTQAFSIIGVSMIALAFSLSAWHPERFEIVMIWCTTLMLIASLFASLLIPSIGIHDSSQFELMGAWKGITYQKNGLGQLASVGMILWTYRWAVGRTRSLFAILGVGLSVFMLLKSRSSTSLLLSTLTCLVLLLQVRPVIRFGGFGPMLAGVLIVALPLVAVSVIAIVGGNDMLAEAFGGLFGKDASFSGRTFIWDEVIQQIRSHPLLGTGFSSFWGDELTRSAGAQAIVERLGWSVPNAHNGYLDLFNELGLIGFMCFLWFLFVHIRDLKRLARLHPRFCALHVSLLIYVMLANLSETGWFHPITLTHVLAMYSSLEVSRQLFEERLRTSAAPDRTTVASVPAHSAGSRIPSA